MSSLERPIKIQVVDEAAAAFLHSTNAPWHETESGIPCPDDRDLSELTDAGVDLVAMAEGVDPSDPETIVLRGLKRQGLKPMLFTSQKPEIAELRQDLYDQAAMRREVFDFLAEDPSQIQY